MGCYTPSPYSALCSSSWSGTGLAPKPPAVPKVGAAFLKSGRVEGGESWPTIRRPILCARKPYAVGGVRRTEDDAGPGCPLEEVLLVEFAQVFIQRPPLIGVGRYGDG